MERIANDNFEKISQFFSKYSNGNETPLALLKECKAIISKDDFLRLLCNL